MDEQETLVKKPAVRKLRVGRLLVVLLVIAAVFIGLVLLVHDKPTAKKAPETPNILTNVPQTSFPLYYPANFPAGFTPNTGSVQAQTSAVSFTINSPSGALAVIQQPLPPTIEEVTKTKEFDTPIGHAYIADVNGSTVGFIQTSKTLIIVSNIGKDQSAELEQLLRSFKPV